MQATYDSDKRKLLSSLCHGAIFFSTAIFSIGVPIVINLISDDPVVKSNAKESINFHFNVWFWATVIGVPLGVLSWLTFGIGGILFFPIVALGFAIHWGLTIWAIIHCLSQSDVPFRYPFIFRVF
ncbi:conserved hypothetical protein [Trichormus variabilis ATCC 29413]|uniref:DUF4870 domain-containing protein n=2 Tax=Anabaena variabilis TaxID=264691 RepID=Q3MAN1_TRIV2|nr:MULTISPECIES: DUF4870 domain-containing protein [Nostocaceae]ABA21955.1 conserved hypothetical protein [Trichormus variabilis ATCC 29413]MBC1217186.1 DUF4870 domain-containing protein [Trichormus variabilis ARAD]MBC1257086.1 DUF4870 domain-containing protein [Trichormus variabilis V5]MBC1270599.1 DUF4870 domain-containing protein [Trichormus variabilis FSR]MBC1303555.1 DUF4870 domain-containing protein [Trichormus variabilis N2B]